MLNKVSRNERGLSLIEVAIALVVIGVISVPFFQQLRIEKEQTDYRKTRGTLVNVRNAINQFYASGAGAYPCPASLAASEGDANFGISVTCDPIASVSLCTTPTWRTTGGGICRTPGANPVLIGAVPFSTLKMKASEVLDVWGNKVLYMVSVRQTVEPTFTLNGGTVVALSVDDPSSPTADGIPDPLPLLYDFVLVSHGKTGAGAFTKDGNIGINCPSPIEGVERENCNLDNRVLLHVNPTNNRAAAQALVPGVNFYDDITEAQQTLPEQTWFQHVDNSAYANNDFLMTLATRVGVGVRSPEARLHVDGSIFVESVSSTTGGQIEADSFCVENPGSEPCMEPELITGALDRMTCEDGSMPGDQVVLQIANNRVFCNASIDNASDPDNSTMQLNLPLPNTAPGCVSGRYTGTDAGGNLICAP